ncbi:MAG: hypothetical protein B6U72_04425 [Candidatus Altiarchaeales archaeon ex4484_2]|nr:MAG: hypothetical protein B6U72_04425 [Candidatus Altiarchaeales archaeon ex4484_2]
MITTLFVGLIQEAVGFTGKTKKTFLDRLRRLTLVIAFDDFRPNPLQEIRQRHQIPESIVRVARKPTFSR